jgi:hypothetical protein
MADLLTVVTHKICYWLVLVSVMLLAILASKTSVEAQCTFVGQVLPRSINDPYDYMRTVIDSLSFVRSSADQATSFVQSSPLPLHLIPLKKLQDDYKCAADMVGKFTSSVDKLISISAGAGSSSYDAMSQLYQKYVSKLTEVLDKAGKGQTPPVGSTMNQFADLIRVIQDQVVLTAQAIGQSEFALVEWTDQTLQAKPTGRLRINEAQRQALIKQIEKDFKSTVQDDSTPFEVTAALIHQFLSEMVSIDRARTR